MHPFLKTTGTLCLVAALAACSSMTTIKATTPGTRLLLKEHTPPALPTSMKLSDTSFGNYEFKAVEPGHEPFFGILPLEFRGGRLALDILFFAPATMFNLRSVFPFYEIDVDAGVVRYKKAESDPWMEYHPKPEERERARRYFGATAVTDQQAP